MPRPSDAPESPPMPFSAALLCAVFTLSGAAALVFEILFFRLAGLALGNSVHAASVVLCSFMAGLGLGNALATRLVTQVRRPLLLFAALEATIACYGIGLIVSFPAISEALIPLFRPLLESGWILQALRLLVAFALFSAPAIAMGMTLPVLVGALSSQDANFGRVLGRLYGWNTLGAVAGALLAERVLVTQLGVVGAGFAAATLDLLAVAGTLWLRRGRLRDALSERDRERAVSDRPHAAGVGALLAAAFLSGAILLALEVVWFRFFLQLKPAFSWNLAVMLATVLSGIAAGGLLGAEIFRRLPDAQRMLGPLALLAGACVAGLYTGLAYGWTRLPSVSATDVYIYLMFPVATLSGVLFTFIGRALEARGLPPTRATGWLALSNTAGSALGSLLGGFWLIPELGVERSFLVLAIAYGGVALLAAVAFRGEGRPRGARLAAAAAFGLAIATFPHGALEERILGRPGSIRSQMLETGRELVSVREATTETIQYFRKDLFGEPLFYNLVTNNHSMSGTPLTSRRYMKLYVYWAAAVHPELREALLISYGVGVTASALADTSSLQSIDVVDISRPILDASEIVYPDPATHPLNDPRVHVHIEDGRFFLQTTERRFDLITGEPPPPRNAGVGNLYSREYFELVREKLRDGGIVTYWLPVYQLRSVEAKAIARAFCEVFPDCSLWSGYWNEWMLVAVKNPGPGVSAESFTRQWRDPVIGADLQALGLPDPRALGATFIADGQRLTSWIGDTPPLVDNHPQRIESRPFVRDDEDQASFVLFMGDPAAEENFLSSPTIATYWPEAFREPDPARARVRRLLNFELWMGAPYRNLHAVLTEPILARYLPWVLHSDADAQAIVTRTLEREGNLERFVPLPRHAFYHLAVAAIREGDYLGAERFLARAGKISQREGKGVADADFQNRAYLLLAAGERERALKLMRQWVASAAVASEELYLDRARDFWSWAREHFGLSVEFEELRPRG